MKLAEFLAKIGDLNSMNIYNCLLIVISIWLASKLIGNNYTTLTGRWGYLILIAGILFWVLKFAGLN